MPSPATRPRRRPIPLAVLALLLLGAPSATSSALAAPAPPVISVAAPVFDFGKVPEGGVIRHVFKVKNDGGSPLEIKSVSAACGCTAAAPKEKEIAPGRTGEIEVKFDTRNRPGRNEKTVTVVSNDPKTPTLSLLIKAEVEQVLGFQLAYTQVGNGGSEPPSVDIPLAGKLAPRARLRVAKLIPADSPARVQVVDNPATPGKQDGLRITVDPAAGLGQGSTRVVVATGVSQVPELEHIVVWAVHGNIAVPRQVHLDLGQPTTREKVIQVTSRRPDFRLTGARVVEGPFQATLLPAAAAPGRSIKLTTSLPAPPTAYTQGKLVLESNDPLEPKKEVTLSIAAARPGR
jgi:hypothetical protein